MGRTWREIPTSGYRNNYKERKYLFASEEKDFHEFSHTKRVRDKDNHGCTYSRPKSFTQNLNRRMRHKENQKLNALVNSSYNTTNYNEHFENVIHEHPQEYKEYYW